MIFFGQDSLLSSVEKFYDKHIVMMCLIEAEPFGCVRLGDAHSVQPYAMFLSVYS